MATSPNHDGPRATTKGIVLHATRGGAASVEQEYRSTVSYLCNPAPGGDPTRAVSAHVVIAFDGEIAYLVPDKLRAWHAEEMNDEYLGIEIIQPHLGDPISDAQYASLAYLVTFWSDRFGFAPTSENLPEHWATAQGRRNGKSDLQAPFDKGRLLELLK